MKRILTGVALATTAALATATPAMAAAPANPVVAVKKKLTPGTGVTFTERTTNDMGGQRTILVRRSGSLQVGKSGIAAAESTGKMNISSFDLEELGDAGDNPFIQLLSAMGDPEHTIRVGSTSYVSGLLWASLLPENKKWLKVQNGPTGGLTGTYGQPINLAETATLKTLFKGAKAVDGGYQGKISVGELRKVSPWLRATWTTPLRAQDAKTPISWKMTVDKAGLPTRLVSTFPATLTGGAGTLSVATSYSGWGTAMSIKAPPALEVATSFADGTGLPTLQIPFGRLAR